MTEFEFVKAILEGQFAAALTFSDWLQDHGEPRRGLLLRTRYRRMLGAIRRAEDEREEHMLASIPRCRYDHEADAVTRDLDEMVERRTKAANNLFRRYIHKRFEREWYRWRREAREARR